MIRFHKKHQSEFHRNGAKIFDRLQPKHKTRVYCRPFLLFDAQHDDDDVVVIPIHNNNNNNNNRMLLSHRRFLLMTPRRYFCKKQQQQHLQQVWKSQRRTSSRLLLVCNNSCDRDETQPTTTTTTTTIRSRRYYNVHTNAGSESTATTATSQEQQQPPPLQPFQQLRIAIVGGGAAGMAAALHLSPLVAAGLIHGPIDVYESSSSSSSSSSTGGGKQIYPGSGAIGREIGVGIWSSAWWPFLHSLEMGIHSSSSSSSDNKQNDHSSMNMTSNSLVKNKLQHEKNRISYKTLLEQLHSCGSYVKHVGYRTPNGSWLVKSQLNDKPWNIHDLLLFPPPSTNIASLTTTPTTTAAATTTTTSTSVDKDSRDDPHNINHHSSPALFFVREKDLLSCLRNAIQIESDIGTIQYHTGRQVKGITNVMGDLGSLILLRRSTTTFVVQEEEKEEKEKVSSSETSISPQYNLIIAADGLYSSLRSQFAGHRIIHTTTEEEEDHHNHEMVSSSSTRASSSWNENNTHGQQQREAIQVENREYIVFRGNVPQKKGVRTKSCVIENDNNNNNNDDDDDEYYCNESFQTWGEDKSMRFAAVPFRYRIQQQDHDYSKVENDDDNDRGTTTDRNKINGQEFVRSCQTKKKQEEEEEEEEVVVWFATISDPIFMDAWKASSSSSGSKNNYDAHRMKQMLLTEFGSWHAPIKTLIETTPAEEIMYELAVSHRHSTGPVCNVGEILDFERVQQQQIARNQTVAKETKKNGREESWNTLHDYDGGRIFGRGPILVFIGDAMMTVDPVLAQGFTIAMESGASLVQSIEDVLLRSYFPTNSIPSSLSSSSSSSISSSPSSIFNHYSQPLRNELLQRHIHRERRLLQLLRSTELVQRMAQPNGITSTVLATYIVRPIIRLCPESWKKKVFDFMIRYSLGMTARRR